MEDSGLPRLDLLVLERVEDDCEGERAMLSANVSPCSSDGRRSGECHSDDGRYPLQRKMWLPSPERLQRLSAAIATGLTTLLRMPMMSRYCWTRARGYAHVIWVLEMVVDVVEPFCGNSLGHLCCIPGLPGALVVAGAGVSEDSFCQDTLE